ncbi:conserved hypothetical protein [Ricinus communis]|uniref:Uncharacterized protein n=1 Tax=Ricinus communis TaxID=3988 RepID=B9S0T1_RICCO|nr:conserved hypothetical protein [Ricinus communis]
MSHRTPREKGKRSRREQPMLSSRSWSNREPLNATRQGMEAPTRRTSAARREDEDIRKVRSSSKITRYGAMSSRRGHNIGSSCVDAHTTSSRRSRRCGRHCHI